jgi:hypothetical protein
VYVSAIWEGIVIRRHFTGARFAISVAVVLAVALQICPVARSQDPPPSQAPPPSLGDVARKNREEKAAKEKNQATPKHTFTNDGLMSGKSGALLGPGVASAAASGGTGSEFSDAFVKMDDATEKLDALGVLDRTTLINNATQGITADFPGRKAWEDRLMVSRDNYVAQGKELIRSTKALMMSAKTLHDEQPNLSQDDPRVKSFLATLQTKMSEAQKLAADFKAIVMEGYDHAAQAAGR